MIKNNIFKSYMKNFGTCIWLTTRKNRYKYLTNGFQLHMSIKTNLNLQTASEKLLSLKNKKYILLLGAWVYEKSDGFYCLYRTVIKIIPEIKNIKNPHVSFFYSYTPICKNQIESVKCTSEIRQIEFEKFQIKNCDDHYLSW